MNEYNCHKSLLRVREQPTLNSPRIPRSGVIPEHWPGESYLLPMARTRLVWKCEEGFGEGETSIGPAWIDTLDKDGKRTSTEEVARGEWIARDEAIRLARGDDHDLPLDE